MHAWAVGVHAACAVVGLTTGGFVLFRGTWLGAHVAAVLAMTGALWTALALGWATFASDGVRVTFVGLGALAIAMSVRAGLAWRAATRDGEVAVTRTSLEHVGFNVISLVVGALIAPALRLDAGPLPPVIAAVVGVVGARWLVLRRVSRWEQRQPSTVHS